jgi:MFS family permease
MASSADNEAPSPVPAAEDWPSRRYAWTVLALLMTALIVSVIDRGVINLMVQPIKAEHGLSDTQFGALLGIAFGTLYVVASIPLGILADRYQRRLVVGVGVTLFSLFSFSTGLARNYTQLFLARMGVGFGEASVSPSGFSLISDTFPPDKVGRAASIFSMGNFIGASLSLVLGGQLYGLFKGIAHDDPGQLLGFAPWQVTIMCIALPGFFLAPLLFLMREPPRHGLLGSSRRLGFGETLRELGKRRRFLFLVIAAMSMGSIMTNSFSAWAPALFIRVYGWDEVQVGTWLGIMILAGAIGGSLLGGWVTDRLTQRKRLDAPITVAAYSFIGVGFVGVAAPLMPTGGLALLLMLIVYFLKPIAFALAPLSLQMVIPNQLRTTTTAIYFTVINFLGLFIGPLLLGYMSDNLFTGPTAVRYSMAVMIAGTVPLMVLLLLLALKPFRALRTEPVGLEAAQPA